MSIQISDWGDFEAVLPLAHKYGVGVEVAEFTIPENLDQSTYIAGTILAKAGELPSLSMHGPFAELVPASRDPMVREVARMRFKQAHQLATRLHAGHLVLHSGFIPRTYQVDSWIHSSVQFWVDFLKDKPAAPLVHVENVYEDDFITLKELIDGVNERFQAETLSACLDIGHVSANSSHTLEEWIVGLGDRIRYTHLHNNGGLLDDHWQLDHGKIDLPAVLNLLSKHAPNAVWTIETIRSDTEPSLEWMQAQGYLQPPV